MIKEIGKHQKTVLHAVSKCLAAIEDLGKNVASILHFMKSMKRENECMQIGEDVFHCLKDILPIESMESFDEVDETLNTDSDFRALMVKLLSLFLLKYGIHVWCLFVTSHSSFFLSRA